MSRRLPIAAGILLVIVVIIFTIITVIIFDRATTVQHNCAAHPEDAANTPVSFSREGFDTTPYLMPTYDTVTFTSRDDDITLSAWFIAANDGIEQAAGTVMIVHGIDDCKWRSFILTPAGMLHRNNFNVLLLDLREHGQSQVVDGRSAVGLDEYRDVLGGYDWLISEHNIAETHIGVIGFSLGGAVATIAASHEPRIAAVWADSTYANLKDILGSETRRAGLPAFFSIGVPLASRVMIGVDITGSSPQHYAQDMNGRSYFIAHGELDERIPVEQASKLADGARLGGVEVEPWIIPGAEHVETIYADPDAYEANLVTFFTAAFNS